MISGMDTDLTLLPVEEDGLPLLEKLTWDPEATGEFERLGWFDRRRWRRGWAKNCLLGEDGGALAVVRDGQRLGFMNWRRRPPGPVAYSWVIGIALLPEARATDTARRRTGCSSGTCSRTPRCTGSRRTPRWPTSRSSGPWRRPGSPGRACCAASAGGTVPGGTA